MYVFIYEEYLHITTGKYIKIYYSDSTNTYIRTVFRTIQKYKLSKHNFCRYTAQKLLE